MEPILTAFYVPQLDSLVQVQSYALAHLLALTVLVALTGWIHARDGGTAGAAIDVLLAAVPAGLIGAALLGFLTSGVWPGLELKGLWSGYRSAYGGLLFGALTGAVAARVRGLDVASFCDAAAPGLAFGAFLCRLGCFLAGCCWGRATTSGMGVRFPIDHAGMLQLPAGEEAWGLHPTQLYLAAAALTIAVVALVMWGLGAGRPGTRFLVAAALYAASTLGIELLRADPGRWFALGLSHNQWISLAILVVIGGWTRAVAGRIRGAT